MPRTQQLVPTAVPNRPLAGYPIQAQRCLDMARKPPNLGALSAKPAIHFSQERAGVLTAPHQDSEISLKSLR
jgi:hypothetical protein